VSTWESLKVWNVFKVWKFEGELYPCRNFCHGLV
jgi:hypothetical protein